MMIFVREDISSETISKHAFRNDNEGISTEMNCGKTHGQRLGHTIPQINPMTISSNP